MRSALPLLVAGLLATTACKEAVITPGNPASPSVTTREPVSGASPATEISVGQKVSATVTLADEPCDTHFLTDAPDPCLRYALRPSSAGLLQVIVTSRGPNWLALRVGSTVRSYGVQTISGAAPVSAGTLYEVSVALHHAIAGSSQSFELTTSLVP